MVVDVKLDLLDIEQCPSEFYASNAFMGTARCDYETTYVSVLIINNSITQTIILQCAIFAFTINVWIFKLII